MRQILYVSVSTAAGYEADLARILEQSRHNNAIDAITGLLWSDGRSFLQVFEGPRASVAPTFERIKADNRHHSIVMLEDRLIVTREFGTFNMVHRRAGEPMDAYDIQMRRLLSEACMEIKGHFDHLVTKGAPLAGCS